MFGLAAWFGTASTGTAIGTLSGAAFTSAALAWLGGSVWTGSVFVFAVPLVAGVGAFYGSKFAWRKWVVGKPREITDLDVAEVAIVRGLDSLLVSLQRPDSSSKLRESAYFVLWTETLGPLIQELEKRLHEEYKEWPSFANRRLARAVLGLKRLRRKTTGRLASISSVPIGVFSATVMELLSDEIDLTSEQEMVVEAFRRQYPHELGDASTEDISDWLQGLASRGSLSKDGALNAVKGKYHEILYVHRENNDGDEWRAELILPSNHEGSDIRLINDWTGEVVEKQIKAGNIAGIRRHQLENPSIPIEATSEAAATTGIPSTGFSQSDLDSEVRETGSLLIESESMQALTQDALDAGINAAFITLAINIGAAVAQNQSTRDAIDNAARRSTTSLSWGAASSILAELFT
jgi:hypothetical protein